MSNSKSNNVIPVDELFPQIKKARSSQKLLAIVSGVINSVPVNGKIGMFLESKPIENMSEKDISEFRQDLDFMGEQIASKINLWLFDHVIFEKRLYDLGFSSDVIFSEFFIPMVDLLVKREQKPFFYYSKNQYRISGNEVIKKKYYFLDSMKEKPFIMDVPAGFGGHRKVA